MHGGSEWPGIGVDINGNVIIPASNIAWVSKLKDPKDFNFSYHMNKIFGSILSIYFNIFITNLFFWDLSFWSSKMAKLGNFFFSAFRSRQIKHTISTCVCS